MENKIKEIIAESLTVPFDKVTLNAELVGHLGADSLDLVDMSINLETAFDITIPDEDFKENTTVSDVINIVEKLKEKGGTMRKRTLIGLMLAITMLLGCATDGQQLPPISPDSQEAIARLTARNAGRAICVLKPAIAPKIAFVSGMLAGENSTLVMLESWTTLLSESMGIVADIEDLMTILQSEGVVDDNFALITSSVLPWMRMCAQAMNQGLAMCVPMEVLKS